MEMVDLCKKMEAAKAFFKTCCRIRDGALESALKRYCDAGKKVWAHAGANHISAILDRIRERRVIVVTLKGSKSVDAGDEKQAT